MLVDILYGVYLHFIVGYNGDCFIYSSQLSNTVQLGTMMLQCNITGYSIQHCSSSSILYTWTKVCALQNWEIFKKFYYNINVHEYWILTWSLYFLVNCLILIIRSCKSLSFQKFFKDVMGKSLLLWKAGCWIDEFFCLLRSLYQIHALLIFSQNIWQVPNLMRCSVIKAIDWQVTKYMWYIVWWNV